ncbi:DUF3231 family protein [Paenalkalicoccus suaedae]|uniref:DUF3231 family protein n=1 Tax=Paenalkalicoccus suaedae TaxID=2592382 RepID=A0A859FAQ8_9BACI|nr:DUF3231 family protein [Paenalkalicoccus suaedae]QKS70047.1 DUF3231 family protein [Paenalkalicoccus suaedae]
MGIMKGNPRNEPMHYGEVFSTWMFVSGAKAMVAGYQTFVNHCGDEDLRSMLKEIIEEAKREESQLTNVLKENEVGLPPSPPERPLASTNDIPVGARFNDPEIAAAVSRDLASGLVACSTAMGQCTREDLCLLFGQMHTEKAQRGIRLLRLTKEKGWLIPPPLHLEQREGVPS